MAIVKIQNKNLWLLSAIAFLFVGAVIVIAELTPNPGHNGTQTHIYINGNSKTLQQAITEGDFSSTFTGGSTNTENISQGHKGETIIVNIGGTIKNLQQAIDDTSLCNTQPGTSPSNFGTYSFGNNGNEIGVTISGIDKTLQQAINDGDFYGCFIPAPTYTLADYFNMQPNTLRLNGGSNDVLVTMKFTSIPLSEFNQSAPIILYDDECETLDCEASGLSTVGQYEVVAQSVQWFGPTPGYATTVLASFDRPVLEPHLTLAQNYVNITGKMNGENDYFYGEGIIFGTLFAGD